MMKIMSMRDLWKSMEVESSRSGLGQGGWLLHRARPEVECHIYVGMETSGMRLGILLRLSSGKSIKLPRRPRIKGLELLIVVNDGISYLGVVLKEQRFTDVFAALGEDLLRRVEGIEDETVRLNAFVGQLTRWQKFLAVPMEGLGESAQQGLWGELYFLREHLLDMVGNQSVLGWKGAVKAHQDFQFTGVGIEIKTTLAKQPQNVRITSERQLDTCTCPLIFLHVISMESRDNDGESLPMLIKSLRCRLAEDDALLESLEDGLLAVGYLDCHVSRYQDTGYLVRAESTFAVKQRFPCLTEKNMPKGVGDVNYGLNLGACTPFSIKLETACRAINTNEKMFGRKGICNG